MVELKLEGLTKHQIYAHHLMNKHRMQHGGELITYTANGGKLIAHDGFEGQNGAGFWSSLWGGIKKAAKAAWPVLKSLGTELLGVNTSGDVGSQIKGALGNAFQQLGNQAKTYAGEQANKYMTKGVSTITNKIQGVNPNTSTATGATPAIKPSSLYGEDGPAPVSQNGSQVASGLRRRHAVKPRF